MTSHTDLQSIFALALRTIRMNRSAWEPQVVQVIIQEVGLSLGIDKDQGPGGRHGKKQVIETLLLHIFFRVDNLRDGRHSVSTRCPQVFVCHELLTFWSTLI